MTVELWERIVKRKELKTLLITKLTGGRKSFNGPTKTVNDRLTVHDNEQHEYRHQVEAVSCT